MPKLDALQTADRLRRQLDKLLGEEDVAVRDLRALLTTQQTAAMDAAWQQQQALRKQKRARTEEEQRALGWKTKREIQIEVVKQVLSEYEENELEELKNQLEGKTVKQSNIFLREFSAARTSGKEFWSAWSWANNELVRSNLPRIDTQVINRVSLRDREVREMEDQILARIRSEMTEEEREQDDMLRECEKTSNKRHSK